MRSLTLPKTEVTSTTASLPSIGTSLKAIAVLTALSVILLFQAWPTFASYFMADDFVWLAFARDTQSAWSVAVQASPGGWTTPIPNLIFHLLFQAFGYNSTGYYLSVLLLHLVNICLLFTLVLVVVRRQMVALIGAALFAVLFLHWSDWGPLVWISAFVQLMAALFYVGSITLFIHYLRSRRAVEYVASIFLFCCALLSKETALSLPLVLLAAGLLLGDSGQRRKRNFILVLIPFFAILTVYLLYELRFQASGSYVSQGHYGLGLHLITNWADFSNLVLPNPNSGPVQSFMSRGLPHWLIYAYDSLVFGTRVLLLGTGVLITIFGSRVTRFWLAFMIVTYLPFLPWGAGYAGPNRYFYLPSIGFCALLGLGTVSVYHWIVRRMGQGRALAFLAVFAVVFWAYNLVPARIWQQQMAVNSEVRRTTVRLITNSLASTPGPTPTVEMRGFPDKYKDLKPGLADLLGVKTEWTAASSDGWGPQAGKLVIQYNDGRVEVHQGSR